MSLFSILFRYKDKKSPDRLGLYPEKFHLEAFPERRYLWASRAFVIFSVLSFCMTIMLVSTIYLLLPQRGARPAFYSINDISSQIEPVSATTIRTYFKDLLTEKYIEEYIKIRHGIPKSSADLFYRWDTNSKFYWFSGIRNYYDFVNKINQYQIKNFIRIKMKRRVEIDSIKKLRPDLWTAQFRTITTAKGFPEPNIIIWRAYLNIVYLEFDKYEDTEKEEREKLNYTTNPFGFKVVKYSLAYAGKQEKAFTAQESAKKAFEQIEDVIK